MDKTKKAKLILICGITISFVVRLSFIINGGDVADVERMHEVGKAVLEGINPYLKKNFYIYPPLWMYVEGLSVIISGFLNLPFQTVIKIWPNVADILIAVFIFRFLLRKKLDPIKASLWSLVFILNPISILISSAHGQFDSIPSLVVLLSLYFLDISKSRKNYYLSALLLGMAVAVKPNPVILLPFFILAGKRDSREEFTYLMIFGVPIGLTLVPFFNSFRETLTSILSYSGVYDFGHAAILRGIWYQRNANYWLPQSENFLNVSKFTFFVGLAILVFFYNRKKNLLTYSLLAYLLFLSFYFGVSAQYYSWVLPFAVLLRDKRVVLFSVAAVPALFGFYMFFNPNILAESLSVAPFRSVYMSIYFFGNVFLWFATSYWLLSLFGVEFVEVFKKMKKARSLVAVSLFALFFISMIPTIKLIISVF